MKKWICIVLLVELITSCSNRQSGEYEVSAGSGSSSLEIHDAANTDTGNPSQKIQYRVNTDTCFFREDALMVEELVFPQIGMSEEEINQFEAWLSENQLSESVRMIRNVAKGETVTYTFGDRYSLPGLESPDDGYLSSIVVTDQTGKEGQMILDHLTRAGGGMLPDSIKNEYWVSAYYYDVFSGKRTLTECEPFWRTEWKTDVGEEWYQALISSFFIISENAFIISGYDRSGANLLITSADMCDGYIRIQAFHHGYAYYPYKHEIFTNEFKEAGIYTVILKEDGDYLELYLDSSEGEPLVTFARAGGHHWTEITEKLRKLACGEEIETDDIVWPRHADGSCEYENTAQALQQIAVKGIYRVSENLRLRETENTSSAVITTMQAGTRVKVLAAGKEEMIDGITASWVQVEVQQEARDKDGNTIPAGTKGWCFGGYLQ